ncbi:SAF domain-containing protein [Rapidithrix thailandica]|uniref:SAF domain-containing protein n=1 Tax=Rapidithrix thailandica TaxID=413964 RepID=A0AAW9SDV0_9BACT
MRPGYGLHPKYLKGILGKTVTQDLKRGIPLTWTYLENK